jgi:type II secretory pathway component HofQ
MRKFLIPALLTCFAVTVFAAAPTLRVARISSTDQRLNVEIQNAPLSSVVRALELHLTRPVAVETGADRVVSFRASSVLAEQALEAIVRAEKLTLESRDGWLAIRDPREATVSLDVKDAELGVILRELKRQCGIRNILVDPDVGERKGTFLFTDVPCSVAFMVVFRSLGLAAELEPNSVLRLQNPR